MTDGGKEHPKTKRLSWYRVIQNANIRVHRGKNILSFKSWSFRRNEWPFWHFPRQVALRDGGGICYKWYSSPYWMLVLDYTFISISIFNFTTFMPTITRGLRIESRRERNELPRLASPRLISFLRFPPKERRRVEGDDVKTSWALPTHLAKT